MKNLFFALLATFVISSNCLAGTAAESISVSDPYVRAVPPGQTVSASFMQLKNSSDKQHAIVNVKSTISKVVELHTHTHENGMMMMRQVEKMEIPANGETVLQPGGLHIMLIGLHNELTLDQKVSLTLEFEDGSSKTIEAPVRKIMMKGMMNSKGMMK
ncbi:MAG: copper chaperone PCu(A)C [gamma proteobacterium symbiont of Taylorina sp.]|nr:copper chaperone PCu(A)C [gamma proteobacterium symbiont of Taylorina sp.]